MIYLLKTSYGNVGALSTFFQFQGLDYKYLHHANQDISDLTTLVLPGVGAFDPYIDYIQSSGLDTLIKTTASSGQKIIGICIGMHILFDSSEEGILSGLSLIRGKVMRLNCGVTTSGKLIRVPHSGWNMVKSTVVSPIKIDEYFYFSHSYAVEAAHDKTIASTHHGIEFASMIRSNNIYGLQFHPEKSGVNGQDLLLKIINLT
ncbi:imidazole glycerol phosphate synthase subunit HisH [Alphaproteobacteria bacterium]|nr:imidazole glycerol phosphate synthase subunit HisH [Alphaproteobacteria bacterium]